MLNDLTPAEQRKRLMDTFADVNAYEICADAGDSIYINEHMQQLAEKVMPEVSDIIALALAAVPKISWVEGENGGMAATAGPFRLTAFETYGRGFKYFISVGRIVVKSGKAPTLEAAQAAAEAALLKLVRGGE